MAADVTLIFDEFALSIYNSYVQRQIFNIPNKFEDDWSHRKKWQPIIKIQDGSFRYLEF